MKWRPMRHFISVSTVCHHTHLGVSSPQRVKTVVLPSDIKCEQERWLHMLFFFLLYKVSWSPTYNTLSPSSQLSSKKNEDCVTFGLKASSWAKGTTSPLWADQEGVQTPCPPLNPPLPTPLVPRLFWNIENKCNLVDSIMSSCNDSSEKIVWKASNFLEKMYKWTYRSRDRLKNWCRAFRICRY